MSKDTEDNATLRYILGKFGKLGSNSAYERFSRYIHWLRTGEWIKLEIDKETIYREQS